MKVIVVIPHYYDASGNGAYGSTGPAAEVRTKALAATIVGLHQAVGPRQAFLYCLHEHVPGRGNGRLLKVNSWAASELDIVVCTSGDRHLAGRLPLPAGLFRQQPVPNEPMMIGFSCRRALQAALGNYDFYCYVEDDLLVTDPMTLAKVSWFSRTFGEDAVLLPHRYEVSAAQPVHKLYIDGPVRPDFTARWQDVEDRRELQADFGGGRLSFERWPNPHSGCFFLDARQMEKWAASPDFDDEDCSFAGPLESAATLGVMKNFRIYKPSATDAAFFEIRHLHNRYLGAALRTN